MLGDIKDKAIIKIDQRGTEAMMHSVNIGDKYYSLTLGNSDKVKKLEEDSNLNFIFTQNSSEVLQANAKVISDTNIVKDLFDRLLDINFTHFKQWDDDLVIMEFSI